MRSATRSTMPRRPDPDWLMTHVQAEQIRDAADRAGMDVEDFVCHVLDRIGSPIKTFYLGHKLVIQLQWLLGGFPLDRAPFLFIHRKYGANPFRGGHDPKRFDMSIDEFINVHVREAIESARNTPISIET